MATIRTILKKDSPSNNGKFPVYIRISDRGKRLHFATGFEASWVTGVSSSGVFIKDPDTTWPSSVSGIPKGWTIYPTVVPADAEAVDLGLSVKWATCNLGATRPEKYGSYFAWGETLPKNAYGANTYKWCMAYNQLTKYCTNKLFGYNGFTDGLSELSPEDDAVQTLLGGKWRMPTETEMTELINQCTWKSTALNGINGWQVTGPTGNMIFLPAAGGWSYNEECDDPGVFGHYWSSKMDVSLQTHAYSLWLYADEVSCSSGGSPRAFGYSIRPVFD